jgi:hypothetical protein
MKVLNEEWRAVKGYEGLYEVSSSGNVKSIFRYKKQLSLFPDIVTNKTWRIYG